MVTKTKCYAICACVSMVFALLLTGIGIFAGTQLNGILKAEAAKNVHLTGKNHDQWGEIPGPLGINITRNYVFYNFENPFETFYFNETPKFTETKGYLYREYQNLSDFKFSDDPVHGKDAIVDYNFQLWLQPEGKVTDDDLVTVPNLGSLGFWYSGHSLPVYQYATYALSALIKTIEDGLPATLGATSLSNNTKTKESSDDMLGKVNINDQELKDFMWNSQLYGISNADGLATWAFAVTDGPESGATEVLRDYFYLNHDEVKKLVSDQSQFYHTLKVANNSVYNYYGCPTNPCDNHFLTLRQWGEQKITMDPAGKVVNATNSVTDFNITAKGAVEIVYYQNSIFLETEPDIEKEDYAELEWEIDLTTRLLAYKPLAGQKYYTAEDTLLHVGNQKLLWETGAEFEKTKIVADLHPIQERFKLPTIYHAHVLYKYMKYFTTQFVLKEDKQATKGHLVMGQFISEALYKNFIWMNDHLLDDLTGRLIEKEIIAKNVQCVEFLYYSSSGLITEELATKLCDTPHFKPFNRQVFSNLVNLCNRMGGEFYNKLTEAGLIESQISNLCNVDDTSSGEVFAPMKTSAELLIRDTYKCGKYYSKATRCSKREIAVMQWSSSAISRNPLPSLKDDLKQGDSISAWYPNDIKKPFEYLAVLGLLHKNIKPEEVQPIGFDNANILLTFDYLLNQVVCQDVFILFETGKIDELDKRILGATNAWHLVSYLRYVMMDLALNGLAQTRPVKELLWGYVDPLIHKVKNGDPLVSGDPSVEDVITIAGQNVTYEQAKAYPVSMFTGKHDTSKTRTFRKYFGSDKVIFPTAYFNGNESVKLDMNPWEEEIALEGGDGTVNVPGLTRGQEVKMYVPDINFMFNLGYTGNNTDHFGVDSYRYGITKETLLNKHNYHANKKWFADKWNGVVNISTPRKCPLYVSKGHFLDVDKEVTDQILVVDKSGNNVTVNAGDHFWLDIEPYSGVAIGANANFQVNAAIAPDELFTSKINTLLPIATTIKGFNMTQEQISTVYGPLKAGLGFRDNAPLVCYILAGILVGLAVYCFLKRRAIYRKTLEILPKEEAGASYYKFDYNPAPLSSDQDLDFHPTQSKLSKDTV